MPPGRAALGGVLFPGKGMALSISKYQRAWINPHSKVVSPLMRKNGMTLAPLLETSLSIKIPRMETPIALCTDSKILEK